MKKSLIAAQSVLLLLSLSSINIANARNGDSNGGLMKEMMSKRFQVATITDPVKQKKLSDTKLQGVHIQGGLMKEMYLEKHPQIVLNDPRKQEHLRAVKIRGFHIEGGLMKEMQDELAELVLTRSDTSV